MAPTWALRNLAAAVRHKTRAAPPGRSRRGGGRIPRKPKRRCAGHAGKRISVMISSGVSAVVSGPRKKSAAAMVRVAGFADDGDLGVAGDGDARHFRGGIGMRQAAADGAAIADLIMRDMPDRLDQKRMRRRTAAHASRISRQRTMAPSVTPSSAILICRSSDSLRRSTRSAGEATRNASIGTKTLAAGERLRFAVVRRQQRHRFGNAGRTGVFEGRKFHGRRPLRTAEIARLIQAFPNIRPVARRSTRTECDVQRARGLLIVFRNMPRARPRARSSNGGSRC